MRQAWQVVAFALSVAVMNSGAAHAWGGRHFRYSQPAAPAAHQVSQAGAPTTNVWPYAPNYGNPVGAMYSKAAGMRQGQFFGTFGLRPADARARGAY